MEDEKEINSKFEITLINDEKEISAKEAALPCKDCWVDFVSCGPQQNDHCNIDYA